MSIIQFIIIYVTVLCTIVCAKFITNNTILTHTSILNQALIEAYTYSRNICGYDFLTSDENGQNRFISHSIGFLKMNYESTLKELNINNDEKLCSMIVSKITIV